MSNDSTADRKNTLCLLLLYGKIYCFRKVDLRVVIYIQEISCSVFDIVDCLPRFYCMFCRYALFRSNKRTKEGIPCLLQYICTQNNFSFLYRIF